MTSPESVFTSSPGMTIRSRSRASCTASWAPVKTLWSVIAIAPRPMLSAWSRRAQARERHSRASGRCACGGRRARRAIGEAVGGLGEPLAACAAPSSTSARARRRAARSPGLRPCAWRKPRRSTAPPLLVLAEPCERGADQLRLVVRARRVDDRHPGRGRLERQALVSPGCGDEARCGAGERLGTAAGVERRPHRDPAAYRSRDVRPPGKRGRPEHDRAPSPAVRRAPERRAQAWKLLGAPLEREPCAGLMGLEELEVDPLRQERVVAREPRGRRGSRLLAHGRQRVHPGGGRSRCFFPGG